MGIRTLRRITGLVVIVGATSIVASGQENAIGGSVRARKGSPLSNVKVWIIQKPSISDDTRDGDGVYVLCVPKSLKKVDIRYQHEGFLEVLDENVGNELEQHKRPIREMRPSDPQSLGQLSESELDQVVGDAKRAITRGAEEDLPGFIEVGRNNLKSLSNAATVFAESGRSLLTENNYGEAESLLKKSLAIQERVLPRGQEYLRTLDDYAVVLRKTNQVEKAKEVEVRAANVRNFPGAFRLSPDESIALVELFKHFPAGEYMRHSTVYSLEMLARTQRERDEELAFIKLNADRLPDLNGRLIPLTASGEQYGRMSVAANESKTFKVHITANTILLAIVISDVKDYELSLLDENNKEVTSRKFQAGIRLGPVAQGGTYTIKLTNKTSSPTSYVLQLVSARR